MIRSRYLTLAALALGVSTALGAQGVQRPRVGVVLSGGGAKGIAHIGVLRVLESEGIYADVVTGTSMGALVGGLYAIGHTTASLDSLVRRLDWASYFLDDPERRFLSLDRRFVGERTMADLALRNWHVSLPTGVVRGQRISELLSRLTWPAQGERDFTRFPRPFAALGTDIETGEAVVLDSGSLATSLRASMSIPGLFDPVRIGNRLLVDGGVTRNLPAREARRLGADILICSDVADPLAPSAELESLVDVLLQTMSIYVDAVSGPDRQLCDVLIRPNAHGTGLDAADFAEAAQWIAIGDSAANAQRGKLREIAARSGGTRVHTPAPAPVRATSLRITGLGGAIEDFARRRLHLPMPTMVSPDRLEEAVARLYATELFNRVTYELDARGGDTAVVISAEPRARDQLGVGVRYDDTYDAALLLSARLRNRLGVGSTTQLDLRLGEQVHAGVEHLSPGIGGTPLAAGAAAGYSYSPMLLYAGDARVGNARVNVTSASVFGSVLRGEEAAIGLELKGEHADVSTTVLGAETTRRQTYASGAVLARSNTLDRAAFPSRGHMLSLRSEYVVGPAPFAHHVGHALLAIPLASRITLAGRAAVGASFPASAVPLHYVFMLGGVYPQVLFPETQVAFVGLRPQQRQGTAMTRVGAALQWEPSRRVFVTLRADAGRVGDRLVWNADAFSAGYGAGVGAITPAGPLELFVSGRAGSKRPLLNISLGNPF